MPGSGSRSEATKIGIGLPLTFCAEKYYEYLEINVG
jgi:hypothetical protein